MTILNFSRAPVVQFRASRYIMRLNRTFEWKVMTIWISRELPLSNFGRLDILFAWIWPPSESYDHLNFSRFSIVQFRVSRFIMRLNQTFELKVKTIWISRELSLFNFEHLDILCAWIRPPSDKLWPFEFLENFRSSISGVSIYHAPESDLRVKSYDHLNFSRASVVQFQGSRYIMLLNQTTELKVMTIWISRELPLFNFEGFDLLFALIWPPSEKFWPFEFLESFHSSISGVSIYYAPESDLRVKSYEDLNFSRASVVQFRASRYIMHLNRTSERKVLTIWISRELPLFNFGRLDIFCSWIGPLSEKLWPFEFLESIQCSISSVWIYYAPESFLRVKSNDHLNFSRTSVAQFLGSRYIMRLNRTSERKVMTIWISRELM